MNAFISKTVVAGAVAAACLFSTSASAAPFADLLDKLRELYTENMPQEANVPR